MKRALLTIAVLGSFAAGVAACFVLIAYRSNETATTIPPQSLVSSRCPSASDIIATGKYVVISIPHDSEFYIGKTSVPLSGISDRIRQLTAGWPAEQRNVFIKGQPAIKYETLSAVLEKGSDADVARIEVVPNRRRPVP